MTPAEFLENYNVTFDWKDNGGSMGKGFQYLITIKVGDKLQYTAEYFMGLGHWKRMASR